MQIEEPRDLRLVFATTGTDPGREMASDSRIGKDVLWTTVTTAALVVGNVVLAWVLARRGAAGYYEPYHLVKRIAAAAVPVASGGLTLGAARFIPASKNEADRERVRLLAIGVPVIVLLLIGAVARCWPNALSGLLFGETSPERLATTWVYCSSVVGASMLYSIYRGERRQASANRVIMLTSAVVPVVVAACAPPAWSVDRILRTTGVLVLTVVCLHGVRMLRGFLVHLSRQSSAGIRIGEVMQFSIVRMPAGLALAGMAIVGPLVANRAGHVLTAGYVLAGLALAQMAGTAMTALSVVLLPHVSAMAGCGELDRIRETAGRTLTVLMVVAAAYVPICTAAAGDITGVWLGHEFERATGAMCVATLAMPAVLLYSVVSSILDGSVRRPYATYGALAGLASTSCVCLIVPADSAVALVWAYVLGAWVVAAVEVGGLVTTYHPFVNLRRIATVGFGSSSVASVVALAAARDWGSEVQRLAAYCLLGLVGTVALVVSIPEFESIRRCLPPWKGER